MAQVGHLPWTCAGSALELSLLCDTRQMDDIEEAPPIQRNVLGGPLEPCGTDPVTGFYRDGCCNTGDEDRGSHTLCAVVSREFLEHHRSIGNDLITPMPMYRFPGLNPGDRWCVTALNWLAAHEAGSAAPLILAGTNEAVLGLIPMETLRLYAVDVPDDVEPFED